MSFTVVNVFIVAPDFVRSVRSKNCIATAVDGREIVTVKALAVVSSTQFTSQS